MRFRILPIEEVEQRRKEAGASWRRLSRSYQKHLPLKRADQRWLSDLMRRFETEAQDGERHDSFGEESPT